MKTILISIKPKWVAKILNGEKTIEIRRSFPKCDLPIDVYIYCTKEEGLVWDKNGKGLVNSKLFPYSKGSPEHDRLLNGKVVAKFTLDKVEEIKYHFDYYNMGEWTESYILENSCLTAKELDNYLQASKEYDETKVSRVYGYGIHISDLEIFDKPRELSEFRKMYRSKGYPQNQSWQLTKAPQSWQFIESEK